jgi:hypothetical protein
MGSGKVNSSGRSRRTCCSPSAEPAPSRPALPGDGPPGPTTTAVCVPLRGNGSLPVRDPYPFVVFFHEHPVLPSVCLDPPQRAPQRLAGGQAFAPGPVPATPHLGGLARSSLTSPPFQTRRKPVAALARRAGVSRSAGIVGVQSSMSQPQVDRLEGGLPLCRTP